MIFNFVFWIENWQVASETKHFYGLCQDEEKRSGKKGEKRKFFKDKKEKKENFWDEKMKLGNNILTQI